MVPTIHTEVSEQSLSIAAATDFVMDPSHGAIDTFVGIVRNNHLSRPVTGITYDAHKVLASRTFYEICTEAKDKWPETHYYVSHFHGELDVGGISIIIAVGSAHREASFDACRYVIEEIKKRSPIWKREHYVEGKSEWLPGHSLNVERNCA